VKLEGAHVVSVDRNECQAFHVRVSKFPKFSLGGSANEGDADLVNLYPEDNLAGILLFFHFLVIFIQNHLHRILFVVLRLHS